MTRCKILKSMRVLAAILFGAALVYAQPLKGLVVTSSILEHKGNTRVLMVGLQNNTDKTIVGFELHATELDGQGNKLGDSGFGQDRLGDASTYIQPGQPATVQGYGVTNDRIVSIKVEVTGVVYLDNTHEGLGTIIMDGRRKHAAQMRKRLAEERLSAEERAALEKQAALLESASQEVQ